MSLNLLTDYLYSFGKNRFSHRKDAIFALLKQYHPDIIGAQEYTKHMKVLLDEMPQYEMVGEFRANHTRAYNEAAPIFYRKDLFELLDYKTIWLSDTPHKRGSKYWYCMFPRVMTYVKLKDKTSGLTFVFANTHLDHQLGHIRFKQVHTILNYLDLNLPTILVGDFNDTSLSHSIQALKEVYTDVISDSIESTLRYPLGSLASHNLPIDHIFISKEFQCLSSQKCIEHYDDTYPSDHYPIFALIKEKDRD